MSGFTPYNSKSESFKKLNPHLYPPFAPVTEMPKVKPDKRLRQSTKPLMNRLETEFYERLCGIYVPSRVHAQAVTLKLANGLRYTPDFFVFQLDGLLRVFEVKGSWVDGDSFPKLKMAAATWPEITFTLAWKDREGQWCEQRILP